MGKAVELEVEGRKAEEVAVLFIAIAERIEIVSGREGGPSFRLEARRAFHNTVRLVVSAFGEHIRAGTMTGYEAVHVQDEVAAVLRQALA